MNGRDISLWVITALTLAAVTGTAGAYAAHRRLPGLPGVPVLILGPALACGVWAAIGWVWYLAGGTVS